MEKHSFPCKSCIKVTKGGCCNQLPIFSLSELSKVIFRHGELIKEKNLSPNKWNKGDGIYLLTPPLTEEQKKKGIALEDFSCPFLDLEKGCLIYEDRPFICRGFGEEFGTCPYKGMDEVKEEHRTAILFVDKNIDFSTVSKIASFYRKDKPLKELPPRKSLKEINKKEFKHLLIAFNEFADILRTTDYFKSDYKYGFIERNSGTFSPYEIVLIKESTPWSALQKPFNFLQRKLMVIDYDFLAPLEEKINKALRPLFDNQKKASTIEERILFSVMYLEKFKENFKNKSKEYKNLINANELYNLKKEIFKRMGFESIIKAYQNERIKDIGETVERVYNLVNSLK